MEGRCSCDPAKHVFSAGCVYGDPQPTPPGCARVVVCRVATSPYLLVGMRLAMSLYNCSSEYHHIAETDMRGVNLEEWSLNGTVVGKQGFPVEYKEDESMYWFGIVGASELEARQTHCASWHSSGSHSKS